MYYGLGVVTFVMWVLVAIWMFGLRDKFSTETTASAYSVFNKDGRSIVGGFTASQFERQLRGPIQMAVADDPLKGPIAEHSQRLSPYNLSNNESSKSCLSDLQRERKRQSAAEAAERRHKEA